MLSLLSCNFLIRFTDLVTLHVACTLRNPYYEIFTWHARGTLRSSSFADSRLRVARAFQHHVSLFVHCIWVAYYGNPAFAFHTLLVACKYRNSVSAVFILHVAHFLGNPASVN